MVTPSARRRLSRRWRRRNGARQRQPLPFQDRPQHRRIAGKFVAELDPFEPRQTRLGEAGFERRVAAQFRQTERLGKSLSGLGPSI
jgi:hypothetical protein